MMENNGGDKDSETDAEDEMLGKLALVFIKGLAKEIRFDFKSDGSFRAAAPLFSSKDEQIGTWRVKGNDLILTVDGEDQKLPILKLTSKRLVIGNKGDSESGELHLKVSR